MRLAVLLLVLGLVLNIGCGYVGPVVPPSPMTPLPVSDLSVVERGDQLYITFTTPLATTDALGVTHFSDVQLRMGPAAEPFDLGQWEANSRLYELPPPADQSDDEGEPKPQPMKKIFPASDWQGKKIVVAVRTAVKSEKHFSQWSNRITIGVEAPLKPPVLTAKGTSQGYRLTWEAERPGLHYQILRSSPTDKQPVAVGVAERPEYIDSTSQWDTPYYYSVIAQDGALVESLPSAPAHVQESDTFAPSIPADVTALAGPESVEISWTRSPESDLKGYLVYRSVNKGPFTVVGELTALPTFSDRKAEHGRTYQYAVSAIDNTNNESDRSKPVEVTF